jgi:hypothetical protein
MHDDAEVLRDASLVPTELSVQSAFHVSCNVEFERHLAVCKFCDRRYIVNSEGVPLEVPRELHVAGVGVWVGPRVVHVDGHPNSLVDSGSQVEVVPGVVLEDQRSVSCSGFALVVEHEEPRRIHLFGVGYHVDGGEVLDESGHWDEEDTVSFIVGVASSLFICHAD